MLTSLTGRLETPHTRLAAQQNSVLGKGGGSKPCIFPKVNMRKKITLCWDVHLSFFNVPHWWCAPAPKCSCLAPGFASGSVAFSIVQVNPRRSTGIAQESNGEPKPSSNNNLIMFRANSYWPNNGLSICFVWLEAELKCLILTARSAAIEYHYVQLEYGTCSKMQ